MDIHPLRIVIAIASALGLAGCAGSQHSAGNDINQRFRQDPDIERFTQRWEGEDREIFRLRADIVSACGFQPGMTVADIGAGTGAFLGELSRAVGTRGEIIAVDISSKFLEHIEDRARSEEGLGNVRTVLGTDTTTNLPAGSIDAAFVCATYHHFEHHDSMLASMRQALRPGGRLAIIDFERLPGVSRQWILDHVRAGRKEVVREITAAGFRLDEGADVPELEDNYFALFHKVGS